MTHEGLFCFRVPLGAKEGAKGGGQNASDAILGRFFRAVDRSCLAYATALNRPALLEARHRAPGVLRGGIITLWACILDYLDYLPKYAVFQVVVLGK